MSTINIFVSQRIDVESTVPDNKIFVPVKCGAVYAEDLSGIQGDNSGENISDKRLSFNEFTVQYWAWKNRKADYVGLCHYRRYLNFSAVEYQENHLSQVQEMILDSLTCNKYGLDSLEQIKKVVLDCDIVTSKQYPVEHISMPNKERPQTVWQLWKMQENLLILPGSLELTLQIIKEKFPEMLGYANKYLNTKQFRGYNCFVMKWDLFDQLCNFEFGVLFELEKQLNTERATEITKRTCGYIGEILYSIFIYAQTQLGKKIKELQLVFFNETKSQTKFSLDEDSCTLVTCADESTFDSLNILIESVKQNVREKCELIVLNRGISKEHQKCLMYQSSKNITVRLCEIDNFLIQSEGVFIKPHRFDPFIYFPWMTTSCKWVLYISPESIVCGDLLKRIREFRLDSNKCLYAVKSYEKLRKINDLYNGGNSLRAKINKMKVGDPYSYFSSSTLYLNLELFRKRYNLFRINEVITASNKGLSNSDLWNLIVDQGDIECVNYDFCLELFVGFENHVFDPAPYTEREFWLKAQSSPTIVYSKFWLDPDSPYASLFWKYARNTCVYERCLRSFYILNAVPRDETSKQNFKIRTFLRNVVNSCFPYDSRRRYWIKRAVPHRIVDFLRTK